MNKLETLFHFALSISKVYRCDKVNIPQRIFNLSAATPESSLREQSLVKLEEANVDDFSYMTSRVCLNVIELVYQYLYRWNYHYPS